MPASFSSPPATRRIFIAGTIIAAMLSAPGPAFTQSGGPTSGQSSGQQPSQQPAAQSRTSRLPPASRGPVVPAQQQPTERGGHGADSNTGRDVAIGVGAGAAALLTLWAVHHATSQGTKEDRSAEKLLKDGPQIPEALDMSGFAVTGLARGNWPVAIDFLIDRPGTVEVDVVAANKQTQHYTLRNQLNRRGIAIFRLPEEFGSKLQPAEYEVHFMAASSAGTTAGSAPTTGATADPGLRAYGIAAGENAVGSIAIDQLTFGPAAIRPKVKEVATYGFHSHSAFDGVRAEFSLTTFSNGHVLMVKDADEKKPFPVGQDERPTRTWDGKGKDGLHMLQVRAWRGQENGGDWVAAWSPDTVDVVR